MSAKHDHNHHPNIHGVRLTSSRPIGPLSKRQLGCLPPTPECIGTFEQSNAQCDGDPRSTDPAAHLPCVWRRYCRGIRRYLLRPETTETLAELQSRLSQQELALHGEQWADRPPYWSRKKRGRRLKAGATRHLGRAVQLHPILVEASQVFRDFLMAALPEATIRVAGSRMVLADVGTFYEQPGLGWRCTHYVRWYCSRGRRQPVCAWRLRLIPDGLISVELPCEPQTLRNVMGPKRCKRLPAYSTFNAGRWLAQLYGLTVGLMGEAAQVVGELVLARALIGVPWPPASEKGASEWQRIAASVGIQSAGTTRGDAQQQ